MNEKYDFALDIDGVACMHADSICEIINKEFNLASSPRDVTTWDHDFGPITFKEAVNKYYPNEEFIISMKVTPGFQEFLNDIKKTHTFIFVTNRSFSHDATKKWIKKYFGESSEVLFLSEKTDLAFDYLIDDYPGHVISAAKSNRKAYLYSQPWNIRDEIEVSKYEKIKIVKSFKEIII